MWYSVVAFVAGLALGAAWGAWCVGKDWDDHERWRDETGRA